jgi:hypothetical protein
MRLPVMVVPFAEATEPGPAKRAETLRPAFSDGATGRQGKLALLYSKPS